MEISPIARYRCDLPDKFGVPRQSGLVEELAGRVMFEREYRSREALRGIGGFSHLWLIWGFDRAAKPAGGWSPTVRPPRLGGNTRMGVFATRSPFRPNGLGLSCVRLTGVEEDGPEAPVLLTAGADLLDGTPIYDVKPYVPYADCRPEALGGFAPEAPPALAVEFEAPPPPGFPAEKLPALRGVLAQDPRPRYHRDPERVYALSFAGHTVRFAVREGTVRVLDIRAGVPAAPPPR